MYLLILLFFVLPQHFVYARERTLWKYQCVDSMKTSRDNARRWKNDPKLSEYIHREVQAIADMGGNCVALGTPYDEEFLPYLRLWVKEARKQHLYIWYRGNFSSWEGWFGYPKSVSVNELVRRSNAFIRANKDLFEDDDIYTASPEAENGGPFNQVEKDEHQGYRDFLVRIHRETKQSFDAIGKNVEVNWLSMNGGLAQRMFDQKTIDALGKTVTLDHYIKTAPEMGEFIEYFRKNFGARTVIGEFGAPIPEINGPMTEEEQADFLNELFRELYKHRYSVYGINYWVTYDSSTAILNMDYSEKRAVEVIRKYFKPGQVKGRVTNTIGDPLKGVTVRTGDELSFTVTNDKGEYSLLLPIEEVQLTFEYGGHRIKRSIVGPDSENDVVRDLSLEPDSKSFFYKLRELFRI